MDEIEETQQKPPSERLRPTLAKMHTAQDSVFKKFADSRQQDHLEPIFAIPECDAISSSKYMSE